MGFARTAGRLATSASFSQFRPRRRPLSSPSRQSPAVWLQERLFSVPSGSRWLRVLQAARLGPEERPSRGHPPAVGSPILDRQDSQDSHQRATSRSRLDPRCITRHLQTMPTAGDGPTKKSTARVYHPRMCTETSIPAGALLHLRVKAALHRNRNSSTRRTRASSHVIGRAPHAVKAPTRRSRVEMGR